MPNVTAPLPQEILDAIANRDAATGDGLAEPDYDCAADRHLLLGEVGRLRSVVQRLAAGRPSAAV